MRADLNIANPFGRVAKTHPFAAMEVDLPSAEAAESVPCWAFKGDIMFVLMPDPVGVVGRETDTVGRETETLERAGAGPALVT